jgi:hypothetical protein
MDTASLSLGTAARAWIIHPSPSSSEIKERVEVYFCFLLWDFVACSMANFTFTKFVT